MPDFYQCESCGTDVPNTEPAFLGRINPEWFERAELGTEIEETMGRSPEETIALCPICTYELLEDSQ